MSAERDVMQHIRAGAVGCGRYGGVRIDDELNARETQWSLGFVAADCTRNRRPSGLLERGKDGESEYERLEHEGHLVLDNTKGPNRAIGGSCLLRLSGPQDPVWKTISVSERRKTDPFTCKPSLSFVRTAFP